MSLWRRLLALHRPHAGWLLLGVLLSLLTVLANVVLMAISGWFITAMALAGVAGVTMNYFTPAAIIRACAIVRTTGRYGERLVTHDATLRMLARLRRWFYEVLEPLSPAGIARERAADLLSRFTADIDTLDNLYLRILLPMTVALLAGLAMVAWLWWQSPLMALVEAALLILAGVIFPAMLARQGGRAAHQALEAQTRLRGRAAETLAGLGELLLHHADAEQALALDEEGRALARAQLSAGRWSSASQALVTLCAWLSLWLLLVFAIPEIELQQRPPAELAMLVLFALASFETVVPMPLAFQNLLPTLAAARRVFELADRAAPVDEPETNAPLPSGHDLRFLDVDYRYPGNDETALERISFGIPEGSRTAIIGATGAGKSTLVQLMARFRLPTRGRVEFAGRDLRHWPGEALRQRLGVVDQHSHLFIGTLRENLLLAQPDADETALMEACEQAQLADWIRSLPEGLDTEIGEAALRISGGEARRLAIARALLRNSPVLILDEPTEGLDPATARALMTTLLETRPERTLVLITHRLTELPRMNQVVLLDQGRLLAIGTHEELLEKSEPYRLLMELTPIAL